MPDIPPPSPPYSVSVLLTIRATAGLSYCVSDVMSPCFWGVFFTLVVFSPLGPRAPIPFPQSPTPSPFPPSGSKFLNLLNWPVFVIPSSCGGFRCPRLQALTAPHFPLHPPRALSYSSPERRPTPPLAGISHQPRYFICYLIFYSPVVCHDHDYRWYAFNGPISPETSRDYRVEIHICTRFIFNLFFGCVLFVDCVMRL